MWGVKRCVVWCDVWCGCLVQCGVVWRAISLVFILTIKRPLKLVWYHILIIGKCNVCTTRTYAILVKIVYDNRNWQDFYPLYFLEYFDKIDSDLKRGSEEEELLNAVKKRHAFGTCAHSIVFFCIMFCGLLAEVSLFLSVGLLLILLSVFYSFFIRRAGFSLFLNHKMNRIREQIRDGEFVM